MLYSTVYVLNKPIKGTVYSGRKGSRVGSVYKIMINSALVKWVEQEKTVSSGLMA
jgi:hypothetical protein